MAQGPTAGGGPDGACVYTTLIGRSELLNEQPTARVSTIPYICLTDDPDLRSDTWQVRLMEAGFEDDPGRHRRDLKLRPHVHLPEVGRSLYIDNAVVLREPGERLLELVPPGTPLGLTHRSSRVPLLEALLVAAHEGLDDSSLVFEQLDQYQRIAPELLDEPVYWTSLLVRDHRDPAVRTLGELWLAQVLRYSPRDQLSLNLAMRRAGLVAHDLVLDDHASPFHSWPHGRGRGQPATPRHDDSALPTAARIAALEQELAQKRLFEAAVLTSRSWRLMNPAREAGNLLRRTLKPPAGPRVRQEPTPPVPGLRTTLRDFIWYRSFDVAYHVRRRRRGRRWLLAGPHMVGPRYMLWKIARLLGIELVMEAAQATPIAVRFEDTTFALSSGPSADVVLNAGCTDISKRRVEHASLAVFGYGIAVDPTTHVGPMVAKSDLNSAHDGVIIEGPIATPEPGKVYQRVLDAEVRPGVVEDLRALVVGSTIAGAYRKERRLAERFADVHRRITFVAPESIFTEDEQALILAVTREFQADLAGLDLVRDRADGRLYVLDVNNTPFAPPNTAYTVAAFRTMNQVAAAFEREWGELLPRDP